MKPVIYTNEGFILDGREYDWARVDHDGRRYVLCREVMFCSCRFDLHHGHDLCVGPNSVINGQPAIVAGSMNDRRGM